MISSYFLYYTQRSFYDYRNEYNEIKRLTRHANTSVNGRLIDASSLVLARIRLAFVDVDFAADPGEAGFALAFERSGGVDARTVVFARRA